MKRLGILLAALLVLTGFPFCFAAAGTTFTGVVTYRSGKNVYLQNGTQVFVDSWNCKVEGNFYDGCSAVVYYTDYPSTENVYHADIYGDPGLRPDPDPPAPVYGSMSGSAYEGGGGYAINLDNGDQVYVDSWKCKVEGQFYDGCSAVVYYTDYPSSDNIYQVDIYGNQGLLIPDGLTVGDDDGSSLYSGFGGLPYGIL